MPAVFEVITTGIESLNKTIQALERSSLAQERLQAATTSATKALGVQVAAGFQMLTKAMETNTTATSANVAAKAAGITSVKQLSAALAKEAVDLSVVNDALITGKVAAVNARESITNLTLATDRHSVKLRESAVAAEANVTATNQLASSYSKVAALTAERMNLESGATASIQKRIAAEEVLTQKLRIRMGVDKAANAAMASYAAQAMTGTAAAQKMVGYKATGLTAASFLTGAEIERESQALRAAEINTMNLSKSQRDAKLITEGLASSIDRSTGSFKRYTQAQRDTHDVLRGLSASTGTLWATYGSTAYILAGFAAASTAIKSSLEGAKFEYATQYTEAMGDVADRTALSLGHMREELLQLNDLRKTPAELAVGLNELVKAGVGRMDALRELPELTKFAVLGEMELGQATQLAVGQANAFGISISDAANMIAKAASISTADLKDMSVAMTQTTELGSIAKISFEEVAAGIALISNQGIIGEKAGTSFRTSIIRMINPTEKLKGMMKDLNVEYSAFNKNGEQKNVQQMFADLDKSISHLTQGDKVAFLTELFSMRGMKGGANVLKEISGGYAEMVTQIKRATEETTFLTQATDELKGTTRGLWEEMVADVTRAFTTIGEKLNGGLVNPILSGISIIAEGMTGTFTNISWSDVFSPFRLAVSGSMSVASSAIKSLLEQLGSSTGDGFFESKFRWLLEHSQSILEKIRNSITNIKLFKSELEDAAGRQKEADAVVAKNRESNSKIATVTPSKPDQISGYYSPANKANRAAVQGIMNNIEQQGFKDRWQIMAEDKAAVDERANAIMDDWDWQMQHQKEQEALQKKEGKTAREALQEQQQIAREKASMLKEARDFQTKMMLDGLEKEQAQIRNAREDALADFAKYKNRFSAEQQTSIKSNIETSYVSGMANAAKEHTEKLKKEQEKVTQNELKQIRRKEEANKEMYEYLGSQGKASADVLFGLKKKALDAELREIRTKTNDEVLINQYAAEKTREIYKEALSTSTKFVDGFTFALMESQEQVANLGSLGKQVFADLQQGISGMYKSMLTGDFSSIGDGLKTMGKTLKDTMLTFMADSLATKTISIGKDLLSSFGLGGIFGGSSGPTYSNGAMNVNVVNGAGLGLGGTATGGFIDTLKTWSTDVFGPVITGYIGKALGAVGVAGGAYSMYAGYKNMKAGNTGTGAVQMAGGAYTAYKGAVTLGIIKEGAATTAAKALAAKMGAAQGTAQAAAYAKTAYVAGKGATSYTTFQTASTASQAGSAGGASAGSYGASAAGAAAYAVPIAAAVLVAMGAYQKSQRPKAQNEIDKMGITPADLGEFYAGWRDIKGTIVETIPVLGGYQTALYDINSGLLVAQGNAGTLALSYHANAEAGHQWELALRTGNEEIRNSIISADQFSNALGTSAEGMSKVSEIAYAEEQAMSALSAALNGSADAAAALRGEENNLAFAADSAASSTALIAGTISDMGSISQQAANKISGAWASIEGISADAKSYTAGFVVGPSTANPYAASAYADGGVLGGGSGKKDDLYLGTVNGKAQMAMGGEYIMPQSATKKYKPILESMRKEEYASGGTIGEFMQSIKEELADLDMDDFQKSIANLARAYEDSVKQAKELKAKPDDLLLIAKLRDKQMAEVRADRNTGIRDFNKGIDSEISRFSMTDKQKEIQDVRDNLKDSLEKAKELGVQEKDLADIRKLANLQIREINNKPLREAVDSLKSFKDSLVGVEDASVTSAQAQSSLQKVLRQARKGDFSGLDKVGDFLSDISIDKSNYATALDYARDYWRTMSSVSELERLTAKQAKIPGYASGGNFPGGLRIVGETGPEIEYTGPSRIYRNDQLIDISALLEEIRLLRQAVNNGNYAVAKNTHKTADELQRMRRDGIIVQEGTV